MNDMLQVSMEASETQLGTANALIDALKNQKGEKTVTPGQVAGVDKAVLDVLESDIADRKTVLEQAKSYADAASESRTQLARDFDAAMDTVEPEITIDQLDTLGLDASEFNLLPFAAKRTRYRVKYNEFVVGVLDLFSDAGKHELTQVFTSNYSDCDSGFSAHRDGYVYQFVRHYNFSSPTMTNAKKTWTPWKQSIRDDAAKQAFILKWCKKARNNGGYDAEADSFYLNGITGITYEEALDIDAYSAQIFAGANADTWRNVGIKLKTNLFNRYRCVNSYIDGYSMELQTLRVGITDDMSSTAHFLGGFFPDCVTVLGIIYLKNTVSFEYCRKIRDIQLVLDGAQGVNIKNCWNISYDSLKFLIDNAVVGNNVTVYVHADVYDKINGEWNDLLNPAALKKVYFAKV